MVYNNFFSHKDLQIKKLSSLIMVMKTVFQQSGNQSTFWISGGFSSALGSFQQDIHGLLG